MCPVRLRVFLLWRPRTQHSPSGHGQTEREWPLVGMSNARNIFRSKSGGARKKYSFVSAWKQRGLFLRITEWPWLCGWRSNWVIDGGPHRQSYKANVTQLYVSYSNTIMTSDIFPDACITLPAKLGSDDDIYGLLSTSFPSVHFNIQMWNIKFKSD